MLAQSQEHVYQEDTGKINEPIAKSLQLCPTLCDPMDCSLQGSSIHGIFQARVRERGAIAFSSGGASDEESTCSC